MTYGDAMGRDDERYELVELDATVSAALEQLPARERPILRMRFVEDLTQTRDRRPRRRLADAGLAPAAPLARQLRALDGRPRRPGSRRIRAGSCRVPLIVQARPTSA